MKDLFYSYIENLAHNPERVDSMFQWTVCVVVMWFTLFKFRERILSGLEGANNKLEAGEIVILVSVLLFPPIVCNVAFFKNTTKTQLYALWAECGILGYALMGRFIFDWALAFITRQPIVKQTVDPEPKTTTTVTTTETK